jgi:sugar transferase (PEP-CTERM/EpsH1 system associated)
MNILYIAHRIPYPPNKGDKIRSFHQIRHLSRRHAVHLACLVDDPADLEHVAKLEEYCASVHVAPLQKAAVRWQAARALVEGPPLSIRAFYSEQLQAHIDRLLREKRLDVIWLFSAASAAYVRRVAHIPRIMDFVDVDSEKWRLYSEYRAFPLSWLFRLEANRLARYEDELARECDVSVFVSTAEAECFARRGASRSTVVIPNGVDLEYFQPAGSIGATPHRPSVIFVGAMDYFPNVDATRYFCREVFPRVRAVLAQTQFVIVGRDPGRPVRQLAYHENVTVTGSVPDVRPYLSEASVAVAPFRIARGVQNKVLEAMAMGVPVVGTSMAFQGIKATEADGVRIADDPKTFAQEVATLLSDSGWRSQCAQRARQYVRRQHRWEDQATHLEAVLEQTCVSHAL